MRTWSSILSASDVERLRTGFACAVPLAGGLAEFASN